jgi:hypothetical protein
VLGKKNKNKKQKTKKSSTSNLVANKKQINDSSLPHIVLAANQKLGILVTHKMYVKD